MPLGWADKQDAEKYRRMVIRLFVELKAKGKINPNYKQDMKAIDILQKSLDHSGSTVNVLDQIVDKYGEDTTFLADVQKYGIQNFNLFVNAFGYLLLLQNLRSYSIIENMFIIMLLGATYGKKQKEKVNGTESLGKIIQIISGFYTNHGLESVLNLDFRSVLAHGWYYFQNDNLMYFDDASLKNPRVMDLATLFLTARRTSHFAAELAQVIEHADWET